MMGPVEDFKQANARFAITWWGIVRFTVITAAGLGLWASGVTWVVWVPALVALAAAIMAGEIAYGLARRRLGAFRNGTEGFTQRREWWLTVMSVKVLGPVKYWEAYGRTGRVARGWAVRDRASGRFPRRARRRAGV